MNTQTIYETGATSHAVNDLILFADNTRELVKLRDHIYTSCANGEIGDYNMHWQFQLDFFPICREWYVTECGINSSRHLFDVTSRQKNEFATIYTNNFSDWKKEHGLA